MTLRALQFRVFRRGSVSYFTAAAFFPRRIRREVASLYAFVRTADDMVDAVPPDEEGFEALAAAWEAAAAGRPSGNPLVDDFAALSARRRFDPAWTRLFLASMRRDLAGAPFAGLDDALGYVHGSAEVVGLFLCRVLGLGDAAFPAARLMGRAMQWANFLRDVGEDAGRGRRYLPPGDGVPDVPGEDWARRNPGAFARWFRGQAALYREWDQGAREGLGLIPRRCRVPVAVAADAYRRTVAVLEADPYLTYRRKVRPSRAWLAYRAAANAASACFGRKTKTPGVPRGDAGRLTDPERN